MNITNVFLHVNDTNERGSQRPVGNQEQGCPVTRLLRVEVFIFLNVLSETESDLLLRL